MKQFQILFFLALVLVLAPKVYAQDPRPVKNLIVMIPDGTSLGVVTAARWYQMYTKSGADKLYIDPYLCGTVVTHSSNAPIGCSASTTSTYMTGFPHRTREIGIYPEADPDNDITPIDPSMAYQPLSNILEAARIQQQKATGLVVTCYFTHATPADCASHYYDRGANEPIASQMAYNNIDVVLGGGVKYLNDDIRGHLKQTGTTLIEKDLDAFRKHPDSGKLWALFADDNFPYEMDRNPNKIPTLEEMTRKATGILSKNENGFFLMVEGSHVDRAAHALDALGCITEFLAFDKAVGAALEFAKQDGETAVVILPDHATAGFTIGSFYCNNYTNKTLTDLFGTVSTFKNSGSEIARKLAKMPSEKIREAFREATSIELTDAEFKTLVRNKSGEEGDYMEVVNSANMISSVNKIINTRTCFGFTSGGHVGDEVFLAVYHPQKDVPIGVNRNYEINHYMRKVLGLKSPLSDLTREIYAKHTDVFAGYSYEIKTVEKGFPTLIVKKGKKTLEVPAHKSVAYLNGKSFDIGSVAVYIDKNNTFYLPKNLVEKL